VARWTRRPEGSNWGDFGDDDELGRVNLLTPEKVRQGVAEVREGRTFCLSLPLDYPGGNVLNPARHPPRLAPSRRPDGKDVYLHEFRDDHGTTDVACDDRVTLHLQYSTQWDALSHIGSHFDADGDGEAEIVFYNGWQADHFVHVDGAAGGQSRAERLGIEKMAAHGVQGRGVMIDLRRHLGDGRTKVAHDTLMRVMDADGVRVEPGDMVCLHTGFADALLAMDRQPDADRLARTGAVLDGTDPALLDWIRSSGLSMLVADNYAVEDRPYDFHGDGCSPLLPIHELCLFKLGIHLGELWHLTALADWLATNGRSRFLLTAPPLYLPGAVGSPVSPVATV